MHQAKCKFKTTSSAELWTLIIMSWLTLQHLPFWRVVLFKSEALITYASMLKFIRLLFGTCLCKYQRHYGQPCAHVVLGEPFKLTFPQLFQDHYSLTKCWMMSSPKKNLHHKLEDYSFWIKVLLLWYFSHLEEAQGHVLHLPTRQVLSQVQFIGSIFAKCHQCTFHHMIVSLPLSGTNCVCATW